VLPTDHPLREKRYLSGRRFRERDPDHVSGSRETASTLSRAGAQAGRRSPGAKNHRVTVAILQLVASRRGGRGIAQLGDQELRRLQVAWIARSIGKERVMSNLHAATTAEMAPAALPPRFPRKRRGAPASRGWTGRPRALGGRPQLSFIQPHRDRVMSPVARAPAWS